MIVSALCAVAEPVRTRFLWRPQLRDPTDEMVLEAAINGNADALVTFNQRDFGNAPGRFGIVMLSPQRGSEEDSDMKKQNSTYPLRLPASLKAAVAEISKEDGTSINQFVTTAVAEKVSAMKTAEFFAERSAEADLEAARRLIRRDGGQPPGPDDRLP